jgi:hypothetical protein
VIVEYLRSGKKYKSEVTLKTKGNSTSMISSEEYDYLAELGFELRDLTRREVATFGVRGIKVVSIVKSSIIDKTNMEPGFIVTSVNHSAVKSLEEMLEIIRQSTGRILLGGYYEYDREEYFYTFNK